MSWYFRLYKSSGSNIKVELNLSNYATKTDLQNVTHVNVSRFASKIDKLDIDKLVPVPNYLAKLSNAVKNDIVKKTEYNKLVTKVDDIDTKDFVKKNIYEKDISDFEDKTSNIDKKNRILVV